MFVLSGGPRAGQLVDDLPTGYRLPGPNIEGPSQLLVGDLVAAVAIWTGPQTPSRR